MLWRETPTSGELIPGTIAGLGLSPVTAALLAQRGLLDAERVQSFLNPRLQEISDPFLVGNMRPAVDRLRRALSRGEEIAVFGDYDADGITSTVLVLELLGRFGRKPRFILPRRMEEGYGLSRGALERMLEDGRPGLLLALDCGTNSAEEVRWLKAGGTDVVILDHHSSHGPGAAEAGAVVVNPHLSDPADAPWLDLCTAGLAFKFAHALLKDLRASGDATALATDVRDFLDLVALGTIADLVTLRGENRILARKGLEKLPSTTRTGLAALYEVSGIETGQPVTPFDIAFRLSPRLNASGRLADAGLAVEMLRGEEWLACLSAARELDRMNRERQDIEREMAKEAMEIVDAREPESAIVVHSKNWHQGVAGIVASRLANHYHRPAIVLCNEEGAFLKGSGRSAQGVDLTSALTSCTGLVETWGGHPMAVGVTLSPEKLDAFRAAFCASVSAMMAGRSAEPVLEIAAWVDVADLSEALFREIDLLGPFGNGNPEPVFAVRGARLAWPAAPFGSGHCRFSIDGPPGAKIACVAWRAGERIPPCGSRVDLAARLTWNVWKGRRSPQLQVEDWRLSAAPEPEILPAPFAGQARRMR